jgi:hypothetical protein
MFADRSDFVTTPGDLLETVEHVVCGAEFLVYSIDFGRKLLTYTDSASRIYSNPGPFLYLSQRALASSIVEVPFGELSDSGWDMRPTFIMSPGRCGSTLLFQLLKATGMSAISEPDVFTNFAIRQAVTHPGIPIRNADRVLRACVQSFHFHWGRAPIIKLRGICVYSIKAILRALPNASFVFLFREKSRWVRSQMRLGNGNAEALSLLLRQSIGAVDVVGRGGRQAHILWYEDLLKKPRAVLSVFSPSNPGNFLTSAIENVLSRDSQAGSPIAKKALKDTNHLESDLQRFDYFWQGWRPLRLIKKYGLQPLL